MSEPYSAFGNAAQAAAELVERIPDGAWDGPGLGEWDLRALVGHTSRSLVTVLEYLARPAAIEELFSAAEYCAFSARAVAVGGEAILERGRAAGRALGDRPATRFWALVHEAIAQASAAPPDRLVTTLGGGMRLANYLPTRTFELAVHGLDIAAATGLSWEPPVAVIGTALEVATQVAVRLDHGADLLRTLTGRAGLPDGFSVT